ncbi:MAG: DedA family protein [Gemmatimonadales bacterium]|nr:DedA family protein [Gemmatimonadales bacterium]
MEALLGSEVAQLWALFAASFLAATLLPGGSEPALFALLRFNPEILWPALAVATVGNTLGGLTSYAIGRLLPERTTRREVEWAKRHGAPVLLFAWAPIVGDALCVAAGWLRLPLLSSTLYMGVGKFARYWIIAQAAV